MARDAGVDSRFERLRALFRHLAAAWPLLGLPAALSGCTCPDDDAVYLLREPDATTQALVDACRASRQDCLALCQHLAFGQAGAGAVKHCELHTSSGEYAEVHVVTDTVCPGGRRPEGLVLAGAGAAGAGELFATVAQLEAASVPAFDRLARELRAHGAPDGFASEAVRAQADERRHARLMAGLARRFGARPPRPVIPDAEVRTLEAVAADNAVEGCVREAYGALVAMHQAARAADPVVRLALASIAADETRHAALSFEIDGWARRRLGAAARRRVDEARRAAHAALARDVAAPVPAATAALAGLPDPAVARGLVEAVGRLAAEAA
jgi:hypothetical protein